MKKTEIEIINNLGLHARAAAKFVTLASRFESEIMIGSPDRLVNGKSIMGVMMLAANKGTLLTLQADGSDEDAALKELTALINNRFDEDA